MSAAAKAAFAKKLETFHEEAVLIPVSVPRPAISDKVHGYFSEILLPPERAPEADVVMLGFPIDIGASYRMVPGIRPSGGSPAEGAVGIRRGLGFCRTYGYAMDIDLKTAIRVADLGNIFITNTDGYDEAFGKLSDVLGAVLELGVTPVILGGDNSTSYIAFKTFAEYHDGNVGMLWLDAHTDTSDNYRGDRYWCGSPMARILELPRGLVDPRNVVMLGIRGFDHSEAMIRHGLDAGAAIYPPELVHERGVVPVLTEILERVQDGTKAFYVMWDPDVMEASFIPGHAIPTTGGLLPHQIKQLIRLVGLAGAGAMDFVEVAPGLDVRDMTVRLASENVLEFIAALARRRADGVDNVWDAVRVLEGSMQPRMG
ncbi:MAG: arginase family protein [Actinomycetia bacterium]|nr:arginase family protein [Actinomycetes bacterium]